jgi:hypothetical protein
MESEYPILRLCNNHWKANAVATAIYSQWYRTYDKKMKPCQDNDNSNGDDSSNGNNSDDDPGDGSNGPPRKKARTMTVVDDDAHFTLPEIETDADNQGTFINRIYTDANNSTESSRSNSGVQHMEDNGSSSRHGMALKDPLYVTT